jgi:lipopolysaccharide/colanic/teichoic acid biosynthesis glycosyltransferase
MYKHFFKRLIDFLISLLALPFVLLTIIIFGPIIFLTDRGPIFYCGERIGKNGKPFKMIKFRSMKVNAPDIRLEDGSAFNGENDPRVTKIGKFLRKTSIDELPQFLNVLVGQMSIIGPRPDRLDWLDRYPDDIKVFLTVRPGITGYSQAYFRNSADGYEKMQNDAYYAKNLSFGLDVKIFFKTIVTVFKQENIYKDTSNEVVANKEIDSIDGND